ncbi:VOC family protein [Bradymonas sediminis]|uniref:Glyoxalase n=1 Tax=Bradymonas sediminis TaxID=1548548 RepID=A0A2Z4FNY4_9DELT|nr:VOC family protein [Bradymonas sediminis]AWV90592.1 glyoxalase [Bradymonas sediminis]TDP62412.1 catechol 2,3-dioxygenase-like lactoylglutathione lyase family enzyme [Bradymonas sediminis]
MSLLHHIALGVAEVEAIAAFYREIFGIQERTRHLYEDGRLRSIWLDMGGPVLMVEHAAALEAPAHQRRALQPSDAVGEGLFLLTFTVADAAERRAVEARAEAAGQPIESRSDFSSYFRDPEGNRVAVSHYPL